jgi:soluble lytic murein transglycosylase-like protein
MHASSRRSIHSLGTAVVLLSVLAGAPAYADIYGYVDERGVAHFSNYVVDKRYYLFKKERQNTAFPGSNLTIINVPYSAPRRPIRVSADQRKQFSPLVAAVAREHKLSAALLHAVITVESGYNPKARSSKGASGLMQLMPETARRYSVRDIWDPRQNLDGGARYLRDLLGMFNNDLSLALAAYNAGEGAVRHYGNRIPPYAETRNYVPRVLQHYQLYADASR